MEQLTNEIATNEQQGASVAAAAVPAVDGAHAPPLQPEPVYGQSFGAADNYTPPLVAPSPYPETVTTPPPPLAQESKMAVAYAPPQPHQPGAAPAAAPEPPASCATVPTVVANIASCPPLVEASVGPPTASVTEGGGESIMSPSSSVTSTTPIAPPLSPSPVSVTTSLSPAVPALSDSRSVESVAGAPPLTYNAQEGGDAMEASHASAPEASVEVESEASAPPATPPHTVIKTETPPSTLVDSATMPNLTAS